MNNNETANEALAVTYEPIELHTQINYNRRSFIDRLLVLNNSKENINKISNVIEGILSIVVKSKGLLFKPLEHDYNDIQLYRDNFREKYFIEFKLIKQILFLTKKNEYFLKLKEIPSKSFRSFIIYCYDFRVYNFNRRFKIHKSESIKFYQTLATLILDSKRNNYSYINWSLVNEKILMDIYKENVINNVDVNLIVSQKTVNFTPTVWCDKKKYMADHQFMPQIVFHSEDDSFLIVCNKPDSKNTNNICHQLSKTIAGKEICNQIIYYIHSEGNSKVECISPSNKDLIDSFEKLYSMCTPRDKTEFKRIDKKWFSKLSDSGWLGLIEKCLQSVSEIVKSLHQLNSFIYLIENANPLWSWLFVSLIQICLQPLARTITGFNSMIKKNWIIMNVFKNSENLNPALFLLFLDCVYQFVRSSPFSFEFNEEMLICLYDLSVISPNCSMKITNYNLEDINWKMIYEDEVCDCFSNKFYDSSVQQAILQVPIIEFCDYESFWIKMYTRWIPFMQIESGGSSLRHYGMTSLLGLQHSVHSNYPFSLNFDKITKYSEDSCHDDTRSLNSIVSEE